MPTDQEQEIKHNGRMRKKSHDQIFIIRLYVIWAWKDVILMYSFLGDSLEKRKWNKQRNVKIHLLVMMRV